MAKYHISKETGRANICRADKRGCPLDADTPHFNSKEEAKAYESSASQEHDLFTSISKNNIKNNRTVKGGDKVFKPSFKNVKSKEEVLRMIRNWKVGEYTRKELDKMDLEYIDVDTSYGSRNATIQLANDDNRSFLQGACLAWAYEAYLQHGGDFVVYTSKGRDITKGNWEGHVALKISDTEMFDAAGLDHYNPSDKKFFCYDTFLDGDCKILTPQEFADIFKMDEISKDYNNIGRYMLGYKVNELLKKDGLL